ncbi:thioredoxin family protein [Azovibrio restrictus]|uniref:thioredoxin family protein n=1 Tax=Azovibrio restrictus TaxID=146938 RepID=UPI0003F56C41|nr:co-chaperone YbbN [Azovibrio restrictus]
MSDATPAFHFDVSLQDFEARVLQPSLEIPVLVDFWAEWCGPCQTLKPMLEKLAEEYQGRFLLAKVNADTNPELSQYFGVRSIPTVVMLVGGQPQDGFTGALPESELRAFIDRFVPPPAADLRAEAAALAQTGDWNGALQILIQATQENPNDEGARLDAVEALLELERKEEAEQLLGLEYSAEADRAQSLKARLALAANAVDTAPLQAKVDANPDDHAARLELAKALAGNGQYEAAMEAALEVVRRDRFFDSGAGRRVLLEFFEALGGNEHYDDLVRKYRRTLSATLN